MVYVGIDLGGTGIKAGVVDETGKILSKVDCPTYLERGHEAVIEDMAKLALKAVEASGHALDDVPYIGCGVPGIGLSDGTVPFCTNLGWHDVPLRALMQKVIDKPIYIDNDATVAALAESVAGVSRGALNSVFLTLGTGLGGGIVIAGKVYSGSHNIGSELGHMVVVIDGDMCTCGNRGCWERYASATALIKQGREAAQAHPECAIAKSVDGDLEKIEARTVINAAKAGDEVAAAVFDRYCFYLSAGINTIINAIDPEIVALGGGVSHAGQFLLDGVRKHVAEHLFYRTMPYARIELAVLGNDAGIIGAAMLGR